MKNSFTEYLKKMGGKEINGMTFQKEKLQKIEIFFLAQIRLKYM
jgi:hypothetical protein